MEQQCCWNGAPLARERTMSGVDQVLTLEQSGESEEIGCGM